MEVVGRRSKWYPSIASAIMLGALMLAPPIALADENGVSFWVPGFFGSLAAAPLSPGFSFANIYYHTSVTAGDDVAFARQVAAGNINVNFTGNLDLDLNASADLFFAIPSYTFKQLLWGGQSTISLAIPYGLSKAGVNATLKGTFGLGPGFTFGGARNDQVTGIGDLVPMVDLRWNAGVHNYMTYLTSNVPIGAYESTRLANLGINHPVIDGGGGYTYLNLKTGREFSTMLGFTYNFINSTTQYQSGVDMHLDWGASQFLTKQVQVGLVGYAFQQLSCDSGSGDRLGCFESRVFSVGPQIGYIIPGTKQQVYINLKGYKEFGSEHRPEGWNVWFTLSISPDMKQHAA